MSSNVSQLQAVSVGNMNKIAEVIAILRDVRPDMTLNQAVVFMLIATNPGISQVQLMDRTGLSDASTSRIISILGKWGNRGTEALGLVEVSPGKDDLRTKACRVSAAGRRLLERMNAVMSKGER